jgi:hypothetical protein
MGSEHFGPVNYQAAVEQPGQPPGLFGFLGHDSRTYSTWVNGNENFYFKATPDETGQLIKLYSEIRLRDHVVMIKQGKKEVRTFEGHKIEYNVNFHFLSGIALSGMRRKGKAETYEPTLTIYVDAGADRASLKEIAIPDNIIVNSEVASWPLKSKATKPNRRLWYVEVVFDDKKPATDFENDLRTRVTLWEEDAEIGFDLDFVDYKGQFSAAFSEKEIADLKAGKTWLTLTVGNQWTAARKDDVKLDLDNMSLDPSKVKVVEVTKPAVQH